MQDKKYYFKILQSKDITNLISNEKIRNIYDNLSFKYFMDDINSNNTMFAIHNEKHLIQMMIKARFVTYNTNSSKNTSTYESSTTKNNSTELIDATFCFYNQFYFFKQVENSFINRILTKLKGNNVYLIDTNVDLVSYNENYTDEQKEIFKFCSYFKDEISNNQFVKSTITTIVGYLIRRFFYRQVIFIQQFSHSIRRKKKV